MLKISSLYAKYLPLDVGLVVDDAGILSSENILIKKY